MADIESPDTYVLGRDTNIGYVCFQNDSTIVDGIADVFPVFFFLVAALVCVTTMNRMVEEQRTQIGILKALGYGEGAIMSKYMIYSGTAAAAGGIVGFFGGTWLFPMVIWYAYGIMYKAEGISYVFEPWLAVLSLLVSLLCSVGTTWLSCHVELSEAAANLMRPKSPKAGKRIFLERLTFLWKRLGFLRKVSLRNIFRYKKRLFMMVLGISGCTALLVTGFGIKDSIADIASLQFEKIQTFDMSIALKNAADDKFMTEMSGLSDAGVQDCLCVMEKNMDLLTANGMKAVILVAGEPERMDRFVNLQTKEGEKIPYPGIGELLNLGTGELSGSETGRLSASGMDRLPDAGLDECVISDKLAEEYNLQIGDFITLRDEDMKEISVRIKGVQENYIYNYVYISEKTWERQHGEEPERKTVYVNMAEGEDAHFISAAFMKLDGVSNVTINADTAERIGTMMKSLDIIVVFVICCAAGLAFVVLYNLTNINITERIREIATIKVLGFFKKETADYVFRENILLTILGMFLGFVLGHYLHRFVIGEIKIDMIKFQVFIKPVSFLYSGVLTLVFTRMINLFMGKKLESISMTESLKSVD